MPVRSPLIAVVIVIVPVAICVPAMLVFVPPTMVLVPAALAGFVEFVPPMISLPAVAAVMFDGLVQMMVRADYSSLAALILVRRCSWCRDKTQRAGKSSNKSHLAEKA